MAFDLSQRNTIWRKYYGNNSQAQDVFGRWMTIHDFEADHIWAESIRGKSVIDNGIPLASSSNSEKSNKTKGFINGRSFEVWHSGVEGIGVLYVNGYKVSRP